TFTYSLTDNAGGRFAINASSGQLTVANGSIIDVSQVSYLIGVHVVDQGGLSVDHSFSISVTSVPGQTLVGSDPSFNGKFTSGGTDPRTGGAGSAPLSGLGGADTLTGGGGNDTITGGDGTDAAVCSGNRSD